MGEERTRSEQWPVRLNPPHIFNPALFIPDGWDGGIGRKLSEASIATMRESGIPLVVAHSWKESPHNSSMRYLERLGFVPVQEYPGYWSEIDLRCSLDGFPCQCTAIE